MAVVYTTAILKRDYSRELVSEQLVKKNSNKGLSASSNYNGNSSAPKLVKTIDYNDENAIIKELKDFENSTAGLQYEKNCTVTADGKVWELNGSSGFVETDLIETQKDGSNLKGSYSYHNHPEDETWFSFSGIDVAFFLEKEQAFSKASDYKYSYIMKRTTDTISAKYEDIVSEFKNIENFDILQMSIANLIDIDTDRYHEVVKILSRRYKFYYAREKKKS